MHVEIQVALNFLISFLYNKLPRRRVNQFGEELENALKVKFEGHWYPEKPYKGSAYRCVRCAPPLDPTVFDTAARASGMDLNDIQENFPQELSIWIDPGEVSYRMSEKGPVKILYSEKSDHNIERDSMDQREVTRTFNPEAQCFKPIECIASSFGAMNISSGGTTSAVCNSYSGDSSPPTYKSGTNSGGSPISSFMANGKTSTPVTFTTATFAQTKFGSTKLKSNSKRSHRMSPTEFSNYIKQRALLQQQAAAAQQSPIGLSQAMAANNTLFSASTSPHNSRSLSPNLTQLDSANGFMLMAAANGANSPTNSGTYGNSPQSAAYPSTNSSADSNRAAFISGLFDNSYLSELVGNVGNGGSVGELAKSASNQQNKSANGMNRFTSFLDKASPFISQPNTTSPTNANNTFTANNLNFGSFSPENTVNGSSGNANNSNSSKAFDNISYNMKGVSYPNQYQHLLVAN